jgi:hypothetical protein
MEWRGLNDDLLVSIAERYRWSAKTTARYIRNLLFALGRRPETMGPQES